MKYYVTVARYGCIYVEADDENSAAEIAERQWMADISWDDNYDVTYVEPYDDDDETFVTKKAY